MSFADVLKGIDAGKRHRSDPDEVPGPKQYPDLDAGSQSDLSQSKSDN